MHRGSVATKVQTSKWKTAHKKVIMLGQEKRPLIVAIFDIILVVIMAQRLIPTMTRDLMRFSDLENLLSIGRILPQSVFAT